MHKSFVLGLLIFKQHQTDKLKRCYWMTASLYRKYNVFSSRESAQTEQNHRTMTFVGLPDLHVYFYLTMVIIIQYKYIIVQLYYLSVSSQTPSLSKRSM